MVATAPPRRFVHQPSNGQAGGVRVVSADGRQIPGETLERLERLDDTVFAALAGDAAALERISAAWCEASYAIDANLLDETRRHYLERAQSRWRRSQESPTDRLTIGFAALEVLATLGA